MIGSPASDVTESRTKWLGGEAHVRYLGTARGPSRLVRWRFGPLALGLAFVAGSMAGSAVMGWLWRRGRSGPRC